MDFFFIYYVFIFYDVVSHILPIVIDRLFFCSILILLCLSSCNHLNQIQLPGCSNSYNTVTFLSDQCSTQ